MFPVLAAASIAIGDPAVLAAEQAARRCDGPAFEAAVDGLEDEALAAMKAANEAVAQAARGGQVGSAGDAEWAQYKALMAAAARARIDGVRTLAACGAVAATTPPSAAPSTLPLAGASNQGRERFHVSLSARHDDLHITSATAIPVVAQTGVYVVSSPTPSGAITFPGGSFQDVTTTLTGRVERLRTRAWDNGLHLGVGFAPDGWREGWRFSGEVSAERGVLKESLAAPLAASTPSIDTSEPPGVRCLISSARTGLCALYGLTAPFSRTLFATPGAFNTPYQTQLDTYAANQKTERYGLSLGVDRAWAVPGRPLTLSLGAAFAVSWWTFENDRLIAGLQENGAPFLASDHVSGEGPLLSAQLRAGVEGRLLHGRLGWSLSGRLGQDWVQLNLHGAGGQSGEVDRAHTSSALGAGLSYRVAGNLRIGLGAERVRPPYVAVHLAPGGDGRGATLSDALGSTVDIGQANAWRSWLNVLQTF